MHVNSLSLFVLNHLIIRNGGRYGLFACLSRWSLQTFRRRGYIFNLRLIRVVFYQSELHIRLLGQFVIVLFFNK